MAHLKEKRITPTYITLKKLNGLVVEPGSSNTKPTAVMTFIHNMASLGYMISNDLYQGFISMDNDAFFSLSKEAFDVLKYERGANVAYNLMYPNFPDQVMNASEAELFQNALLHYLSGGHWSPEFAETPRGKAFETIDFSVVDRVTVDDYYGVLTGILQSNESLSETDKTIMQWMIDHEPSAPIPDVIPYKENAAVVASYLLSKNKPLDSVIKNPTDVLRLITHLSGGDVSLSEKTTYKSLPKSTRRVLVKELERVWNDADIKRHQQKWILVFHNLHIGQFSKTLFDKASKFRNNEPVRTVYSDVEHLIAAKKTLKAADVLKTRPGDFARRLDAVMRSTKVAATQTKVINKFNEVVPAVSTRVLTQVIGHFRTRDNGNSRYVMPKGNMAHMYRINPPTGKVKSSDIVNTVETRLVERFKEMPSLGKVWIDDRLFSCPLPTAQRSASDGLVTVARGTRIPLDDKDTIRTFIYWVGRDIDLSMAAYNDDLTKTASLSYYNLRDSFGGHSGDITYAPNGAAEMIDISKTKALEAGYRYLAMCVYVYSGPSFSKHEVCYAGWMSRDKPSKSPVYDAAMVNQKISVTSNTKNAIPVIFDLKENVAIWTDIGLNHNENPDHLPNNVRSTEVTLREKIEMFLNYDKYSLGDLFMLHAVARGTEIVTSPDDADIRFGMDKHLCDVTPESITVINDEYMK